MSTILLADDSPHAQRMGEHILRSEGFDVTTVADGPALLAGLAQNSPDLVIADAFLPGSNGLDFVREIKKSWPYIRIILTAGSQESFDNEAARRAGCDAVLRKPFEASEVLTAVRPLLQHATTQPGRIQDAVEAAVLKALPSLVRDITEKVLIALDQQRNAR